MDQDPCTERVWWSAISAAQGDSTLAGVLAGLLIAAAAALLVGWYEGSDPHTIALFGSGVPALAFSTYLFTVIAGMKFPAKNGRNDADIDKVCSQMWSQWLLAMGLLFIGGAVLVCGLGWALVSYADNLAVRLCNRRPPLIATVEARRLYFIRLSGWLSGGVINTTIAILIPADVLYVKTIPQGFLGSSHAKWYTMFAIFTLGSLLIIRSTYVAIDRTWSAQMANRRSCTAYTGGRSLKAPHNRTIPRLFSESRAVLPRLTKARVSTEAVRVGKEAAAVASVVLCAALAVHMTSASSGKYWADQSKLILVVVCLYIVSRGAYIVIAGTAHRLTADYDDTSPNLGFLAAADPEPQEAIRLKYSIGKLSVTTRCVVGLAILAAFFDVALTQGAFGTLQIMISLFLGGVCPALILTGLSDSIPAAEKGWWPQDFHDANRWPPPSGQAASTRVESL